MRFLIRTGTFILQLGVFFLLLALLSWAATYLTAERYAPGNTPSRLFPIVALPPATTAGAAPQYELLRWAQITRKDPPPLSWNLRLPDAQGYFVSPLPGGYEPDVSFSTAALADGRQRVSVKVSDDDYVLYASYVTDGARVEPQSFRVWGPTSALVALFPAFVLTVVMFRLVRRWREKTKTPPA
jgi:hypothetical protein